jgi:hypothetical protein
MKRYILPEKISALIRGAMVLLLSAFICADPALSSALEAVAVQVTSINRVVIDPASRMLTVARIKAELPLTKETFQATKNAESGVQVKHSFERPEGGTYR